MSVLNFLNVNKLIFSTLLLILASTSLFASMTEEDPQVESELEKVFSQRSLLERITGQGLVRGFESDLNTLSWQGIPFAKPPIGELRWKAPRPPELRERTLNAINNNAMCLQKAGPLVTLNVLTWNDVIGDEDCLYLNITAPKDIAVDEQLPVMFWIHGGGNSIGYKGNSAYTGEQLANKGRVILVAVNYRLGPMGWFLHPALVKSSDSNSDGNEYSAADKSGNYLLEDKSGNYGTLDLIAALKWTQANIENFGGDPNNITVFGESAGGFNTYSLIVSPLAKNLFHRAIVESGGYGTSSPEFASQTAKLGGHHSSSAEITQKVFLNSEIASNKNEAYEKQNSLSAKKIAQILRDFDGKALVDFYRSRAAGMLDWPSMTPDGYVIPKANITELLKNKETFNAMPIMLGTNRDENKTFLALDPEYVGFGFRIKDKEKYNRTAKYLVDNWKINGVDNNARILTESQNKVYAYRFDWDELPTVGWVNLSELIGAGHGLEIPFVFGGLKSDFNLDLLFGSDESNRRQNLSDTMMTYWTNFAYTGSPNSKPSNTIPSSDLPKWTAWNNESGADKFIILDAGEGAIKMSNQELFEDQLKARLENDEGITSTKKRCELYKSLFVPQDLSGFDMSEYLKFRKGGCSQYPL
jgi:para-nitrobenzyl esterase